MNFKLIIFLFFISACGVKGDPIAPKSDNLPSLIENYPDIETDKRLDEFQRRR